MNDAEIDALLSKAATSALASDEVEKLRQLVETLKFLTGELDKKRVSVRRLKRLLFGDQDERLSGARLRKLIADNGKIGEALNNTTPEQGENRATTNQCNEPAERPKRKGHGRRGADQYSGAERRHLSHPTIRHKSPCSACANGKLLQQKRPKVMVRMVGSAPVQATVVTYDWYRCGDCGAIVTTPLPEEYGSGDKFDESVTATIALHRYGYGMPFNRLEQLQENVSIPLPASTQWDLVDLPSANLEVVFIELIRDAAKGEVMHNDDTVARILELIQARKKMPPDEKSKGHKRTGTFTTGLISKSGNRQIALYLTGPNHAGENLASVLAECEPDRDPVLQMSDGLSCNEAKVLPPGLEVIHANCLAHGRRKYVEIADSFPEQCLHVLSELKKVYKAEAEARAAKMNPQERLAYHQTHSGPVMAELKAWLQNQLDEKLVEPNSPFGEASAYMLKRWDRLTRFLTVAGAPIDNNVCERALKRSIRHRKNSLFYKTLHGARVGDIYMSLIQTCELNGINPFTYLTRLIREGERLAENPRRWLPWNYQATETPTAEPGPA